MFSSIHQTGGKRFSPAAIALLATLAFSATGAQAQAPADSGAISLEALEEKINILERKLELQEEDAAAKKETNATVTAGKDGFSIVSADKHSSLKLRALAQVDGRYVLDDGTDAFQNTFLVRRLRSFVDATLFKYYGFRFVPEFGGGSVSLLDAFVEVNFWPEAKLRFGKFTPPIGIERIQSNSDNYFAEYALPSSLSPTRDLGVQLSGDFQNESYSYALGLFNGAIDQASKEADDSDHKTVYGRVFALPFKTGNSEIVRNLGFGISGSYGENHGDSATTLVSTIRLPSQRSINVYRTGSRDTAVVRADGWQTRINPQAYWYLGSFGLYGEYAISNQEVRKGKSGTVTELGLQAWQGTLSYVITGESPSFKGLKPRKPVDFTPGKAGFGAIELVGRIANIAVDEAAFPLYANANSVPKEARTYSGGVNWYLSSSVKWLFDYEHTIFDGGAAAGKDRDDEKFLASRVQLAF